jgi:hypothetical protein
MERKEGDDLEEVDPRESKGGAYDQTRANQEGSSMGKRFLVLRKEAGMIGGC